MCVWGLKAFKGWGWLETLEGPFYFNTSHLEVSEQHNLHTRDGEPMKV